MKNFFQWAEAKNFDLSFLSDTEESKKANTSESGAAKRAAPSANYPDAYGRAQYPGLYFTPGAADAPYKLQAKPKKVPDNAP